MRAVTNVLRRQKKSESTIFWAESNAMLQCCLQCPLKSSPTEVPLIYINTRLLKGRLSFLIFIGYAQATVVTDVRCTDVATNSNPRVLIERHSVTCYRSHNDCDCSVSLALGSPFGECACNHVNSLHAKFVVHTTFWCLLSVLGF